MAHQIRPVQKISGPPPTVNSVSQQHHVIPPTCIICALRMFELYSERIFTNDSQAFTSTCNFGTEGPGLRGKGSQRRVGRVKEMLQLGLLAAGHLPIFFAMFFTLMLSASYVFAVWQGDVDPVFPYISSSGDHRPESCFFSMMLNLCSFLIMLIIYLRYSLVVELNRDSDYLLKRLNVFTFIVGMIGGVGMFVVANFQESAVITVHLTGAFLCFGCGCFYMLLQFCLTVYMHPLYNSRRIGFIRGAIALSAILCFITVISFGIAASKEFHKHYPDLPTPRPWSRKTYQPGYNLHCVSAIAEWCLAVCNVLFILSFSRDFEKLRVELSVQPLVSHLDHSPLWRSATDLNSLY